MRSLIMRSSKHMPSLVFIVGMLIMLVAYYPSLFHSFRADTITLVRQYALKTGFIDSVVRMYGISRDLAISGGDYTQFRPICYWLIGSEYWFFRYNFMLWQAVGIILHGMVIFILYRLLLNISKKDHDIVAALFTAFFASLLVSAELVIWQGCHSWLLLVLFVLLAMHNALYYIGGDYKLRHLFFVSVCLGLACFTSEVGMFLAFPLSCYVVVVSPVGKKWRALWTFVPILLYVLISYVDSSKAAMQVGTEFADIVQRIWSLTTLYNLFISVAWWLYAGFFPGELQLELSGRLMEIEPISDVVSRFNWTNAPFWLGVAGIVLVVAMLLKGARRKTPSWRRFFSAAVFACMAAYVFVLVVVRLNVRGVESLNSGLYYSYLFWAVCIVWIYSLVDADSLLNIRSIRLLCGVLAMCLIVWNATLVFKLNSWIAPSFADNKKTVAMVNAFVESHKNETDFSFYIPPDYPGNFAMPYVKTQHVWTCSFIEALFPKYFNGENPKYSFGIDTPLNGAAN